MKDLMQFDEVKTALSQVVAESDVNNGTLGMEFLAYSYSRDTVYDKKKAENQVKMAKALLSGDLKAAEEAQKLLENPEPTKVITVWKLVQPLKKVMGTKILHDGERKFSISMEDVKLLHIPEDSIRLGLIQAEETGDEEENIYGNKVKVLRMKIVKGLIDVAAPVLDRWDKEILPKRAFVTPISYRAMQIAGELMATERMKGKRRYGFDEMM